jgi:CRP-like cAMP-binding protein
MYILQSGRVAIKKKVEDGETVLAVLEKGDFFGEMAILERLPRSATPRWWRRATSSSSAATCSGT